MNSNRVTGLAAMVISVVYLYLIGMIETSPFGDPVGPKLFPLLCGFGMLLTGLALFLIDMFFIDKGSGPISFSHKKGQFFKSPLVFITAIGCIYGQTFESLGYLISTTILIMGIMTYLQRKKWIANTVFSIFFSLGSYFVFVKILNLSFPQGILAL